MIAVDALTVAFGRSLALNALDLRVTEGICGLFGPNGSGKTTLLRVLSGLLTPTSGMATFGGAPIDARDEEFRRAVGYAGHAPGLYEHLTVGENLELFAHLHGAPNARVDGTLAALGLEDRRDDRVSQLSAGLKRRAAVARAIVHDPRLLLLDEPYANLDDEASDLVSATLVAWSGAGKVALVATHGAKKLKPIINTRVILKQGRLASFLTAEDLSARQEARR